MKNTTDQAKMGTGTLVMFNHEVYAELIDVSPPPFSIEKVDCTSHDSLNEVFIAGMSTYGDMNIKGFFTNSAAQQVLRLNSIGKKMGAWRFVFPVGLNFLTYLVTGYCTTFKQTTPLKGSPITFEATITPTQAVTLIPTAGHHLTTPFLSVTNQLVASRTLAPDADGDVFSYDCTLAGTDTGYKITPTATLGSIYVDGAEVTSGSASGVINFLLTEFPFGTTKTTYVVVEGTNQCPTIYKIRFIRGT